MFVNGMYELKWYNKKGEEIFKEKVYLNARDYRREVMKMQTAFLQDVDVNRMVVTPIENN